MSSRPLAAAALAAALAACGGTPDRGPAWPKPSPSETDGGESLEPRQPGSVAAALEDADDAPSSAAPDAPTGPAGSPAASPGASPAAPATEPAPDEEPDVLTTEELVIEIED